MNDQAATAVGTNADDGRVLHEPNESFVEARQIVERHDGPVELGESLAGGRDGRSVRTGVLGAPPLLVLELFDVVAKLPQPAFQPNLRAVSNEIDEPLYEVGGCSVPCRHGQ